MTGAVEVRVMMHSLRRAAIVAALGLLSAGCGTTVAGTSATESNAAGQTGSLSVPTPGPLSSGGVALPGSGDVSSSGTAGGGTGVGGPGSTAATLGGAAAGGGTGSSGSSSVMGPGVTATKIYVGLTWAKNQDAVNQAAGAGGISVSPFAGTCSITDPPDDSSKST